ncbi:DNA-directed polymerase delta regulatory subunit, putative [Ichthyophthirius multifiliis]|uniref:DNA-directed polymerase delta regulatory subunit, putative n=1 Tax=Ichthyophthirius multifiliis TaxID=5932 RepID=G0QKL5_ICHMU|nr:DNA-directed polymerase delta regulatory subunit, putative [Ichthyophthirius multifiliis]EGR34233.1 DNA-directed polymerase delta regulatory subunit, putative [Ichthyophthirius multifiliis]|eukprot:XP_004039537.1 DNA-directed polymerase delta regulatory subunit, putative [Ichthyophthirius multifiliis]
MKLKPSVFSEQNQKVNNNNYISDDDIIYMEDNLGRMQLSFNNSIYVNPLGQKSPINKDMLVTGIVMGIKGIQRAAEVNVFEVQEMYSCLLPYQEKKVSIPYPLSTNFNQNQYDFQYYLQDNLENIGNFVIFTSGIHIDSKVDKFSLKMFTSILVGNSNLKKIMQNVNRVIIAGNVIEKVQGLDYNLVGSYRCQDQFKNLYSEISQKMKDVDELISQLSYNTSLDIMPGEKDPTPMFLPQQPINKCYFMQSINNKNLQCVTNPYKFEIDGIQFLGTSGQNVSDIKKYSSLNDNEIDILENNIYWRHMFPSAPDTLQCYPFGDQDNFIIDELPHVYFSGNCSKFDTKLIYDEKVKSSCRLICIPQLSVCKSFILLNISNLDVFQIHL